MADKGRFSAIEKRKTVNIALNLANLRSFSKEEIVGGDEDRTPLSARGIGWRPVQERDVSTSRSVMFHREMQRFYDKVDTEREDCLSI